MTGVDANLAVAGARLLSRAAGDIGASCEGGRRGFSRPERRIQAGRPRPESQSAEGRLPAGGAIQVGKRLAECPLAGSGSSQRDVAGLVIAIEYGTGSGSVCDRHIQGHLHKPIVVERNLSDRQRAQAGFRQRGEFGERGSE